MNHTYPEYWPQYFTATIHERKHLLSNNYCKEIIVGSLKLLVTDKRIVLNAFVIMSNHVHLIWQPLAGFTPSSIQASFMKYTSQQLKRFTEKNNKDFLATS